MKKCFIEWSALYCKCTPWTHHCCTRQQGLANIEYSRGALPCTLPPVWLVSRTVYLIYFLIGNLSYTTCSEPSRTDLLLDVMYIMDSHHRSKSNSPPWATPFNLFLHAWHTETSIGREKLIKALSSQRVYQKKSCMKSLLNQTNFVTAW